MTLLRPLKPADPCSSAKASFVEDLGRKKDYQHEDRRLQWGEGTRSRRSTSIEVVDCDGTEALDRGGANKLRCGDAEDLDREEGAPTSTS